MRLYTPLLLFLVAIAGSSCQRYYYRPTGVNAPLLANKNDVHVVAAGFTTQNPEETNKVFDAHAAWSPLNHIGIIASYSSLSYTTTTPVTTIGRVNASAQLIDFGAGYYRTWGSKFRIVGDVYAGGGVGSMSSDINMEGTRFFLQPGAGIRHKYFDVSLNVRFTGIKYGNLNTNGRDNAYLQQQELIDNQNRRIDERIFWFYEPCLTIRGGYRFVKLQVQGVYANKLSAFDWSYSRGRVTVGLYFAVEELVGFLKKE